MRTALFTAGAASPRALWTGAGTNLSHGPLLRAHRLVHDGVLDGDAFGRNLASASAELTQPVRRLPVGAVAIAAFIDTARVWHRANGTSTSPFYVDAGVGLRLHLPGERGVMRVDVAHGLRGGGLAVSAGVTTSWLR